ncbi:uncharacterized protein LOC106804464 [Setaria italica]|uniref:uncharacterized protein LOC106804464 n=1 Tax=Setaria italica TaxID=4555 RepID=UPI0007199DB8|nr:uncharacterized protein LOC106804464 [Setaria italica]
MDDTIFGGYSHALVAKFAEDICREFEISMMGELTLFLRLQIKKNKDGTFVHQGKYIKDVLRKFDMADAKPLSTPMAMKTALDADEDGEPVDQKEYRSMIGSLLYLMATRPDIHFAVCLYRLDHKSTSGTCQFLGSSLVSWSSRKQSSVAQSTTKAKYVAAASCCF